MGLLFAGTLGFVFGFLAATCAQTSAERNDVEKGYTKLCGDYYKLEKIAKENGNENRT